MSEDRYGKKFYTGYVSFDFAYYDYPKPPYSGRGWKVGFEKQSQNYSSYGPDSYEVVIYSKLRKTAEKALDLIRCGLSLVHPQMSEINELVSEEEIDSVVNSRNKEHNSWIPLGCLIAAKCSQRLNLQFAIAMYRAATRLHTYHFMQFDPSNHAYEHPGVPWLIGDSVCNAYAVILGYSIIEQLGLKINVKFGEKSRYPDGKWNPAVLDSLENRLRESNIDLDEGVFWMTRGRRTKIQEKKLLKEVSRPSYSKGPYVRDKMVNICDAISVASYYRSSVASHKMKKQTRLLTPIDVDNVLGLAHHLLMSKLKLKGYATKLYKKAYQNTE